MRNITAIPASIPVAAPGCRTRPWSSRTDGSSEVINKIAFADEAIHNVYVADVLDGAAEMREFFQRGDVFELTRREVIDDGDVLSLRQQALGQMTANEASPAGNEDVGQGRGGAKGEGAKG